MNVDERRDVTETLALTAVIVHDLKQRRRKNYAFNWDDALQVIQLNCLAQNFSQAYPVWSIFEKSHQYY